MFYDNWVARDINGTALENAPFEQIFHHTESEKRFMHHLPVQGESHRAVPTISLPFEISDLGEGLIATMPCFCVTYFACSAVQSCWNGIAVLDPAPFYNPPHVRFRMAKLSEGECSASECGLICSGCLQRASASVLSRLIGLWCSELDDYWNSGYGRIIMVPRVKLAYDKVSPPCSPHITCSPSN